MNRSMNKYLPSIFRSQIIEWPLVVAGNCKSGMTHQMVSLSKHTDLEIMQYGGIALIPKLASPHTAEYIISAVAFLDEGASLLMCELESHVM